MKNNYPALLLAGAFILSCPAPVVAQAPSTLAFAQGGQFRLSISSTDPNMIFVPGDRITAITAQGGMLADRRTTSSGGVLFTSVAAKPFTLFVETALGQAFSVVATPVKGEGRVYRLVSAEPPARPETRQWETAQSYETLLVRLARAVLSGNMPEGYGEVAPSAEGIPIPAGFAVTPRNAWAGDRLRADRYTLRNTGGSEITLREQDFWAPGVRAVMFDNSARTLLGGGTLMMTVIRSGGEGSHGQPQ